MKNNELNFERIMWIDGQAFIQARKGAPALELYFENAQEIINSCEEDYYE